jgi:hypothetical protein
MNFAGVVRQLKEARSRAEAEVKRLDQALAALGSLNSSFRGVRPKKRKVSAAARRRMALAQRTRRAREKGAAARPKAPIPIHSKRHISAAGMASIRAAQRARWAKWKKQKAAS